MTISNTDLLRDLPLGWTRTPLRYATQCLDGKRIPLNVEQRSGREGDYPYWGSNGVVDSIDDYIFDEPLVLLGEDGAPFFDAAKPVAFHVTGKIWVNNHIHVLRVSDKFDPRFFAQCLNATDYGPWIEGSTRDKLTQENMGSIRIPTPPLSDQVAIADYLDRETARLDALIAAKERLLELLAEKRRALIARAVTRGLDPHAPLRDSGIPWLGKIPAHWRVERIKRLFRFQKRQGFEDLTVLSVYREFGVIEKHSRDDNANRTPDDLSSYQLVEPGDLVINKMKAWQGSLGVSSHEGITSPDYAVYAPIHRESEVFLHHTLRRAEMADVYRTNSNGIRPSQWRIEPDRFEQIELALPPIDEQRQIVGFIVRGTSSLDQLLEKGRQAIDLLRERRAALIAAAITGQIEIGRAPSGETTGSSLDVGRQPARRQDRTP